MQNPPQNKLSINHNDLLNLPKKSFRKGGIKKREYKKKKSGKDSLSQVIKGISPQFPPKKVNVKIMSKIIEE